MRLQERSATFLDLKGLRQHSRRYDARSVAGQTPIRARTAATAAGSERASEPSQIYFGGTPLAFPFPRRAVQGRSLVPPSVMLAGLGKRGHCSCLTRLRVTPLNRPLNSSRFRRTW